MMKARATLGRLFSIVVPLLIMVVGMWPNVATAQEQSDKVVRVGWFDSTFNTMDALGRRSGYAYEYQLKVAAYTGWKYEYVNGSWSELLQMLVDGRIDLMSDVSYTDQRAKDMLFPDYSMGAEEYYLFVAHDNTEISSQDVSTLNGKRVGVNKDSIQADLYRSWAKRMGVTAEVVEMTVTEDESLRLLDDGELDAYVTVDFFTDPGRAMPMFKVGSSDFFFAVSKKRPELLPELNDAMGRIREENSSINQELMDRFVRRAGANAFLTASEREWLDEHGTIRVGYQDNYLAFCDADDVSGELVGALGDYLKLASGGLQNAQLDFSAKAFPTIEAAFAALEAGEVDCVFPANLDGYDGERTGVMMTQPLMRTDLYAVVRQSDVNTFANREHVVVAVDQGNLNYESTLSVSFPTWRTVYFENTEACLKAVANSVADCVLISNYRYNNISRTCERLRLTTIPTSVGLDSCMAVALGNSELYAILQKVVSQVPASTVHTALSYYISEDAKQTLGDYLADNMTPVLVVAASIMLVIVFLMVRSMRAEKRARELIAATETDVLTGLYNRDYFFQYANQMRHDHPDEVMDAIVVNIDQFHSINALSGRDFGDQVLRVLATEIHAIAESRGGLAGRFGADRFDIFSRHDPDYQALYARLQDKLASVSPNASIRLRMGVLAGETTLEPIQMFDRARTACNMARGNSIEHLIIFNDKVRQRELFEQRLLNDLKRALDGFEFEVFYQPKFDIQADPPRLVSAEALVRWLHPELGMIAPSDFIPLFERNGDIEEIDKFVWAQAARQITGWRAEFGVTLPVSVNLSRVDVFDPALETTLEGILSVNGLDHDALKLEVTESAYIENADQMTRVVKGLRRRGFTMEMDDFGSGYSSLNILSDIEIDVLKIDRAFIEGVDCDERKQRMVELIVGVARNLNMTVVAEGVETESQLRLLKDLGCQLVQGYYFSAPLHPSDFEDRFFRREER